MERLAQWICEHKKTVVIISLLLLIPSMIGMLATRINYDILVYLPQDIETVKGENILTDDFGMGSFAICVADNVSSRELLSLEGKIRDVKGVEKVASICDLTGTSIPVQMIPTDVAQKVAKGNTKLLLITFRDATSADETLDAVSEIRSITSDSVKIGGMSAMVLDTMELSEKEVAIYIVIAVVLCLIVLMLSLDSYFVPLLLLGNIGIAILYNMGTNIFFGNISYITKAISAVLQLGVTTDFSIFLYHKYENLKNNYPTREEAMCEAIKQTFTSVMGSSLTTIAGFLALVTMSLTLGKDIGLVMAKGVLLGVVCVLTVLPSLLLLFNKVIDKTSHKVILPSFDKLKDFTVKHYKAIFVVFLILAVPAFIGNKNVGVYYNLDRTLPDTLPSRIANEELKDTYDIVSPEIILLDKTISNEKTKEMIDKISKIDGITMTLSPTEIYSVGVPDEMIPNKIKDVFENDKYRLILINSNYEIATDALNNQITQVSSIVKSYDENAIIAGEGPLMKDLVTVSDKDFHSVNYTSLAVIFVILVIVLKSASLPVLLVAAIEFAIFLNMSVPFYMGSEIPFISSIVIGTIQLGATIDYAILMTTKYLEARKGGKECIPSIREALEHSVSSIIVSGMCFFAATFGVGIYSKLEMIGSLCSLISRGALISMVVVIMVVPSMLIIFDKIIMKTTINKKRLGIVK